MDKENRLILSKYRLEKAKQDIDTARLNFRDGHFNASANRSYYAVFHALRAVLALDGFDSKKHQGVIAYFNRSYVMTGIFPPGTSSIIESAFKLRGNADYKDYYEVTPEQAQEQISNAEGMISMIQAYLESCWAEMEEKQ